MPYTNNSLFPSALDPVVPAPGLQGILTESQIEFGAMQAVVRSSCWMTAWDALYGRVPRWRGRGRVAAPRATLTA